MGFLFQTNNSEIQWTYCLDPISFYFIKQGESNPFPACMKVKIGFHLGVSLKVYQWNI